MPVSFEQDSLAPTRSPGAPTIGGGGGNGSNAKSNDPYPEQRHAGAVGVGPNYGTAATMGDKVQGMMQQMKGKVMRDPELAERGREMRTGELQEKEHEAAMNEDPFWSKNDAEPHSVRTVPKEEANKARSGPPYVKDMSHPSEQGRREQAATVAPEGSEDAEMQRMGNETTAA
ncbi:hypothetical protein CERSUDRAFT_95621 [Gelatoporia subvermispora B]|uniref:Uncharacterized protein n=1 Tax=Ceriporiopsis subvermispora (strain B) TaxID=914234 RepID=M2RBV4_CERS8|nr:hypothetical protein CERSUDRAFT_95621 [Gelatoporia subvermispora B]